MDILIRAGLDIGNCRVVSDVLDRDMRDDVCRVALDVAVQWRHLVNRTSLQVDTCSLCVLVDNTAALAGVISTGVLN